MCHGAEKNTEEAPKSEERASFSNLHSSRKSSFTSSGLNQFQNGRDSKIRYLHKAGHRNSGSRTSRRLAPSDSCGSRLDRSKSMARMSKRNHPPAFNAQVVLTAGRGDRMLPDLAQHTLDAAERPSVRWMPLRAASSRWQPRRPRFPPPDLRRFSPATTRPLVRSWRGLRQLRITQRWVAGVTEILNDTLDQSRCPSTMWFG